MGLVNVTGFQRARRLAAQKAREEELRRAVNEYANDNQNSLVTDAMLDEAHALNEQFNNDKTPLSPDDVDGMEIEKVKELLDQFEVKFARNTGEEKLREKLKNAIG